MHTYKGVFEAHITIEPLQIDAQTKFIAFCAKNNLKPIQIELSRGDVAFQQMTSSIHEGAFEQVLAVVKGIAELLGRQGFGVSRVKLEAAPSNENLPATCAELMEHSAENYFEHHLKLSLPTDLAGKLETLLQICETHHAHLSRNAFKQNIEGFMERFVTVRHYGLGKAEAIEALNALKMAITVEGLQILKTITEYCVYDDHVALDANWLIVEPQSPCETCDSACILSPV